MYLSQLELHGFKSFANKTTVSFDSGITAIVGPNGCGKSNIVDALRWVLGEQRASLLRSSAMQNVIFNGTASKKALGMAEVSVTVENNLGILPLEYSEVTITRRLYRSGDSEYLINGSVCRLKDIVDLFMDTGMGPGAYSVIELKMVEEILNDKNNDRLRLFEEAAGVTRYKEKRKQTLRKLDETLKDLIRVEDILVEIRKKVRSLQLQAKKAKRAKEYTDQLYKLDLAWNSYEYKRILEELKPLQNSLLEAEKEKKTLQQKLAGLEESEVLIKNTLSEKEGRLYEARNLASSLEKKLTETKTSIKINEGNIENEKQVILNFEADINQAERDITDLKKSKTIATKSLEERKQALEQAKGELEKFREAYGASENEVSELRKNIRNLTNEQEMLNRKIADLRSAKIRLDSRKENAQEDLKRIENQQKETKSQLIEIDKELSELQKNLTSQKTKRDDARLAQDEIRTAKEQISAQLDELRDRLRKETSRIESLLSERELLKQIAQSHDTFPGSVQHLMSGKKSFGFLEVVTDVLSTGSEYAVALEASLGEACNYLVVENAADAQKAFSVLQKDKKGRAAIIPLDMLENLSALVHKDSLAHLVQCEPRFEKLKRILLGDVCLADSIEDGIQKVKEDQLTRVTKGGDVITREGILKSGSKQKNIGIRTGLKDRIETIDKKAEQSDAVIKETRDQISEIEHKRATLDEEQARKEYELAESKVRETEQRINSLKSRNELLSKAVQDLEQREKDINESNLKSESDLAGLEPEIHQLNERLEQIIEELLGLRNKLRDKDAQLRRSQSSMNDARVTVQRLQSETERFEQEIRQAENGINTIKQRLEQRAEQAKISREKIKQLTEQTELLRSDVEEKEQEKTQADAALEEAEQQAQHQRGKLRGTEDEIRQVHRKREINSELIHELEIKQNRLEMQSQGLLDYIWETYSMVIEQIEETFDEDTDPNTAKTTITNLKERLKSIGEVNHLAIEEYEEEVERLEFYESQISDLREAEEKLRNTIREINKTANERFNKTFIDIRDNFKRVFGMLFNEDDHCDLVLRDKSDDPLDNKIEIIARPRGKRPSNIEQLSGGEKTLTSIALLFAIYLVKPSPFCILDEVDAPLDDANIERFTHLIRQFSNETQFIVITHNKKTMDKSEVMYGVTMQETGVSRLVGVRLEQAEA